MWPLVTKKDILYLNNKPYMTKRVKDCIDRKTIDFNYNEGAGVKVVLKEPNQLLRTSWGHYRAEFHVYELYEDSY